MHTTHYLLRLSRSRACTAAACAVIALGCLHSRPAAAALDDAPRLVLRFSSPIDTTAAAEQLYARIRTAARRVCSNHYGRTIQEWQAYRACAANAVAQAVAEVDSPALADRHRRAVEGQARRVVNARRSASSATT